MADKNKEQLIEQIHKFEKQLARKPSKLLIEHTTLKGLKEQVRELKYTLMEKGELAARDSHLYRGAAHIEQRMPTEAGNVLAAFIQNPEKHMQELAEYSEMSQGMITSFIKRMKQKAPLLIEAGKQMNTNELIAEFNDKIRTALYYMDESTFARASLKDLGMFVNVMVDKMRLFQGEPTQILTVNERKELPVLLVDLNIQMAKRGIEMPEAKIIEGEVVESG